MATGTGTVTLDFGAAPGSYEASIAFTDAGIGATSKVEAWIMGAETTSDHTALDHRWLDTFVTLTAVPSAGVGGTIYCTSIYSFEGTFKIRYVWAD